MESGPAVGVVETAALEEPRCAGVALFRNRPEETHLVLDALPRRAPVVGGAAGGGEAQLLEDLLGAGVSEVLALAETVGEVDEDPPVHPRIAGRVDGLVDLDDATLAGRGGAFVFLVQRPGQHDVGVVGRLRQEEVDDGVELEPIERLRGELCVGRRHSRVEADRQQPLDLPGVDRLDDLLGGDPLTRDLVLVAAPHRRDVGPVVGVRDVAVAGELVALVAMFPTALAVALPGDRRHAAPRLAVLAGGQAEVDRGQHVLRAFALLLDPHACKSIPVPDVPHHSAACSIRAAGTPVTSAAHCGVIEAASGGGLLEAIGVGGDEVVVEPVVLDQLVQHGAEQGGVRARPYGEGTGQRCVPAAPPGGPGR